MERKNKHTCKEILLHKTRAFVTIEILIALALLIFVIHQFFDLIAYYGDMKNNRILLRDVGQAQIDIAKKQELISHNFEIKTQNGLICSGELLRNKGGVVYRFFDIKQCE